MTPARGSGRRRGNHVTSWIRSIAGLGTVAVIGLVAAVAAALFRGSFTESVPVTVISDRAGLVMNPDAKVKMRGVQIGKVASIEDLPQGRAAVHLAIDPRRLKLVPSNVAVDISSTTVFGAKFIQLISPPRPSSDRLRPGQVIQAEHVTVEINSVFERLTQLLSSIEPSKMNEILTGLASGLSGRGQKLGQTISDLDVTLAKLEPSLPALAHDIAVAPAVFNAYADASPDLVDIAHNSSQLSRTIVAEQRNLDQLLLNVIGLAQTGNDVIGANRKPLADVMHLLAPLTGLTNEYNAALTCTLSAMIAMSKFSPLKSPGAEVITGLVWGAERYRYPGDLPKVAAKGGPQCGALPDIPFESRQPFVVADTGANPWKYDNPGIFLNFAGLKELLLGPIDGPPRNTYQLGQPG